MSRAGVVTLVLITKLFSGCSGDAGDGIQEPDPVTRVTISAPTTRIRVGDTVQLTATARGADGNPLGRDFTWTSGIETVASVSAGGLVTGLVKGASEIRATADGVTGTIVIDVSVGPRRDDVIGDMR